MLWRARKPVRGGARLPDGFILPCQPTLAVQAPSGPGWIHELKHDGWRLVARKQGADVRLWTRQAKDVTDWFPLIAEAVAALPVASILIDGEAMLHRPDGHSDFDALRSRAGAAEAMMIGFDVMILDGQDLRREPVEFRRDTLAWIIGAGGPGLAMSEPIVGDGALIFQRACELGCEGIVSKRLGSRYRSGRSADWLKTKWAGYARRAVTSTS